MANKNSSMEANILNYSNEIQTIENFADAVRQTLGMYIGRRGNRGFMNMIREVYQNSIDELIKENSPCNWVHVFYNENDHCVMIEDNGRGIPFDNIIRVFTKQHTSSNYKKQDGEYSSGMNGVGAKVTNALSTKFLVDSYILGQGRHVEFYDGKPWDKGEVVIKKLPREQGTTITFWPAIDVLGELTLTADEVYAMMKVILSLTPIGSRVVFDFIKADGKQYHDEIVNELGIMTHLVDKIPNPLVRPIVLKRDIKSDGMRAELAFTFDTSAIVPEEVVSFANFCPTEAGTHVEGLIDGIVTYFRTYMNKIYLANNKKITVSASDIKMGLKAIISVAHINPIFSGQAKEVLNNEDMGPFVRSLVIEGLEQWSKQNPTDLQKLCKYFKDMAEARLKTDTEKIKVQKNYAARANGLPEKYVDALTKRTELLIVEGDSALGSARNSRNQHYQALFPIRGKIPNALDTPRDKFLKNTEVQAIIQLCTNGTMKIRDKFELSNCPFEYIIFCADADPDGGHIDSLLLYFFAMYMPELITAGRVYRAVPPLYGATVGNTKIYFTNNMDLTVYIQNIFMRNHSLSTPDGQKMTKNEMTKIFVTLDKYVKELSKVAVNFALNPQVLEFFLFNLDKDFKTLRTMAKKEYRFLETSQPFELINGCPTGSWPVDGRIQNLHLNDTIINQCSEVLDMIHKVPYTHYRLDGELVTLFTLMTFFEQNRPKNIGRYKGLGEMNPNELAESTILPTTNRTLIRYTMDDVAEQIERIRYMNSNKSALLENIQIRAEDID